MLQPLQIFGGADDIEGRFVNVAYGYREMFPMVNQAWADGDPPDRPLTSNEKAYFEKVLKTIRTALPPAPENWT